ncbi:hypothetical protein JCM18904_4190 [Vibrio sp. JCM 18904]|nr:hypothetical protein JCM18904_4190 [Vibrio sp. JCM 18904]
MSDSSENRTRTNVTNRLFGSYQAEVVNTVHPKGLYMVSVRLLGYWDAIPDKDLPFAEFLLPLGAKPSGGHAVPVEKGGDLVWVDFPRNGDTRYPPRITGSLYYAPNYESYLPSEVNGEAISLNEPMENPSHQPMTAKMRSLCDLVCASSSRIKAATQ